MKPIICPKCSGRLEQVVYRGGEVDRTLECAGIWFDSLEAEKLKKIKGSETLDIGSPDIGTQLDRIPGKIDCPRCREKMSRLLDIDEYSIWYEKCSECHGVWLDAGEFKRFKQNFRHRDLKQLARRLFRLRR